jgi:hypothetical protein
LVVAKASFNESVVFLSELTWDFSVAISAKLLSSFVQAEKTTITNINTVKHFNNPFDILIILIFEKMKCKYGKIKDFKN